MTGGLRFGATRVQRLSIGDAEQESAEPAFGGIVFALTKGFGEGDQSLLGDVFGVGLHQSHRSRETDDGFAKSLGERIPGLAIGEIAQSFQDGRGGDPGHGCPRRGETLGQSISRRRGKSREIARPTVNTPCHH
jgi:hypothetical protein